MIEVMAQMVEPAPWGGWTGLLLPILGGGVVASLVTQVFIWWRERWVREESRREKQRELIVPILRLSSDVQRDVDGVRQFVDESRSADMPLTLDVMERIVGVLKLLNDNREVVLEARIGVVDRKAFRLMGDYRDAFERLLGVTSAGLVRFQKLSGRETTNAQVLELLDHAVSDLLGKHRELLKVAEGRLAPQRTWREKFTYWRLKKAQKGERERWEAMNGDEAFEDLIARYAPEVEKQGKSGDEETPSASRFGPRWLPSWLRRPPPS